MQSKNKRPPNAREQWHIDAVRLIAMCSVCDTTASEFDVHEIKQGQWFTSMLLCRSCHTGPLMGWHGNKVAWHLRKMDELDALAVTIRRLETAMLAAVNAGTLLEHTMATRTPVKAAPKTAAKASKAAPAKAGAKPAPAAFGAKAPPFKASPAPKVPAKGKSPY